MRNVAMCAIFAGLFLAVSTPTLAEPTIVGPSGLFVNPTADITAQEHAWIALNFLDNDDNSIWTLNFTGSDVGFLVCKISARPSAFAIAYHKAPRKNIVGEREYYLARRWNELGDQ